MILPLFQLRMIIKSELRAKGNDGVLDAKHAERHQRVGAEVKAGAYFAQCGRLFADDNFGAPPFERQCRGKAADTTADDDNTWCARHWSPPFADVQCRVAQLARL